MLRDSLDDEYARFYLITLVSRHHLNNRIRDLERRRPIQVPLDDEVEREDKDDGTVNMPKQIEEEK